MAAFSGFRPFLTKGSTLNGARNTFFTNNENGVYYLPDATDVYSATSLATFSEGISAVLDEKNGIPTLGPNLIINGTFDTNINGWVAGTAGTWHSSGRLQVYNDGTGAGTPGVYLSIATVAGVWYKLTFSWDSGTHGNPFFAVGNVVGANDIVAYTQLGAGTGTRTAYFRATGPIAYPFIGVWGGTLTTVAYFDNVSLNSISGNLAVQTSTSLRPLFGRAPVSRRNLLNYTEQFDNNTFWGKDGTTVAVTSNSQEWYLANNGVLASCSLTQAVSPSGNGIFAIDLKADTLRYVRLRFLNVTNANLVHADLQTGTTDGLPATNLGDGFYRFYLAFTSGADNVGIITIQLSDSYGSAGVTPSSTKRIIMRRPQFELGSTATAYQRINAATDMTETGVTSYPFIRSDLSDDVLTTNLGSTKNLLRFTEEFDNAAWIKVGVTAATTQNIIETATTGQHVIYQASLALTSATLFVDAKANGRDWLRIGLRSGGSARSAYFNLSTGIVGSVTLGLTSSIQSLGNGVYRCIVSGPTEANASGLQIGPTTGDGVSSHTGDGVSGVTLERVQLESNTSATAYEYGGFKGTALVSGRSGTSIDTVSIPNGVFSLGPATYTGGSPGILRAVGDIVGYTVTGRTTTSIEQDLLIDFYKFRGAKGRLITGGAEFVTNGTFDNGTTSWIARSTAQLSIVDGKMNVYAQQSSAFGGDEAGQTFTVIPGTSYEYSVELSGPGTFRVSDGGFNNVHLFSGPVVQGLNRGIVRPTTSVLAVRLASFTALTTSIWDNVSVKELRPKEAW